MKKWIALFALIALCISAGAHEYILLAYKYSLAKGDTLEMHLFVADGFNIQLERPMQTGITKRFELITGNGITDLKKETKDSVLPIVNRRVDWKGLGLLAMERNYARIALPPDKFLNYLKEDHIENIDTQNIDRSKDQRERYSRYIKALVQSGKTDDNDTLYRRITHQKLEIVLLQNPYRLKVGDTLSAQVFFEGMPLTNKMITARNRTGSESSLALTSRTNKQGICSFKIGRKGEWFLHSTHMIECPDKNDADWESFWASYSFEII